MNTLTFTASNIKCGGCVSNIENSLSEMSGVESIDVDIERGSVEINGSNLDRNKISTILSELGYPEK